MEIIFSNIIFDTEKVFYNDSNTVSKTTSTRVREDCGFFELLVKVVEVFLCW